MPEEKKEKQERKSGGKLFYYGSDQTVKDAGSFSFFTPLGSKVATNSTIDSTLTVNAFNQGDVIPGIAVVDYEYVPGLSEDGASPINIASKKLYTYVRHQNSGSRNYDSPDLTNYCYAVGSTYAFLAQLQRAYGIIKLYSGKNRYLGKAIVEALGFNYDDLATNLAGFRQLININALKVSALKVPADWPAVTRQILMNSCILKDGDIEKSQLYVFRNNVIWKYNETGTYVGCLTPEYPFGIGGATKLTIATTKLLLDTIVSALVASEDVNIMSGDILKAYGDKVLALGQINEDYAIGPVWNEDLLQIFHNIQFVAPSMTYGTGSGSEPFVGNIIWQDTVNNCLMFKPIPVHSQGVDYEETSGGFRFSVIMSDGVIDSTKDDPDAYSVMNMMSSKVLLDVDDIIVNNTNGRYISFGTELYMAIRLYANPNNIDPTILGYGREVCTMYSTYVFTSVYAGGTMLIPWAGTCLTNMLSCFDWAPRIVICGGHDDSGATKSVAEKVNLGDIYNYSKFTAADAIKCHTAQVLAGFGIA